MVERLKMSRQAVDKEDVEIIEELREHGYKKPEKTLRSIKRGLEESKARRVSKVGSFAKYAEEK